MKCKMIALMFALLSYAAVVTAASAQLTLPPLMIPTQPPVSSTSAGSSQAASSGAASTDNAAPAPPPAALPVQSNIFASNDLPLVLHLSELGPSWRRFGVGAVDQGLGALGAYMSVLSGGENLGGDYFTDGRTVAIGDTEYLVAYRLPVKKVDFSSILGQHADYSVLPDQVTPDSIVSLSLLNLHTISALDDIRPFDMTTLIQDNNNQRAKLADVLGERSDMEAQTNLQQLSSALISEATDHNGTIPAVSNPSTLKRAIFDDVKTDSAFLDPMTKRPFQTNPFLSGHKMTEYDKPGNVVLLYADAAGQDGLRAVAFLNGDVRMVDRDEWQHLQSEQHLP